MNNTIKLKSTKNIALVAHDHKKTDLVEWCYANRKSLKKHNLYATGITAQIVQDTIHTPVHHLLGGALGGDAKLSQMMQEGELDALIFFWDTKKNPKHANNIKTLLNVAITSNIHTASNIATADIVLAALDIFEDTVSQVPVYLLPNMANNLPLIKKLAIAE